MSFMNFEALCRVCDVVLLGLSEKNSIKKEQKNE